MTMTKARVWAAIGWPCRPYSSVRKEIAEKIRSISSRVHGSVLGRPSRIASSPTAGLLTMKSDFTQNAKKLFITSWFLRWVVEESVHRRAELYQVRECHL